MVSRAVASFSRLLPLGVVVGAVAAATLAPRAAMASGASEVSSRVESIAAKGTVPPMVPVVGGLGLGVAAALLALGMERRSRRSSR